jgi:hypothetical protein
VYVEAKSPDNVRRVCQHSTLISNKFDIADPRDVLALLGHRSPDFKLGKFPWVHVKRGLYKGDLGYLVSCDHGRPDPHVLVLVIPRISPDVLHPASDEDLDRKPVQSKSPPDPQSEKRKRQVKIPRPPARYFDPIFSKATWEHVGARRLSRRLKYLKDDRWKFQNQTYVHGLLELKISPHSLNFTPTIPT